MDLDHYYVLQGNYGGQAGWEDLTAEETREEIVERRNEYRDNAPGRYRIVTRSKSQS